MAHNTTKQFGIPPDSYLGTFEVLIDAEKAIDVILKPGEVEGVELPPNVHIIPSKRKLEAIAAALAERDKFRSPLDVLQAPLPVIRTCEPEKPKVRAWNFRDQFPAPLDDSILYGVFGDQNPTADQIESIHVEQPRRTHPPQRTADVPGPGDARVLC